MIHISNGLGRRILTFPAVHPCEAIPPATLLGSLITLASNTCGYKPKFFASNKRNAREAIRQIGVLLIFLEEVREWQSGFPDSVVLSFSELHLAFQKIQYLLEDCTREGARLWILIKFEQVANQFHVLIRAIATALDVLHLEWIDVSSEAKELIQLVMRQSRKTRFKAERDDKRVSKEVLSILDQFKNNVVPEVSDLRRVLDHLNIRSWSDCNKEIKFLDAEIGLECLNTEKKEVALLSSLMGFMSYCRCVLFHAADSRAPRQSDGGGGGGGSEVLNCLNPDDFRCPISLEIMTDPVTIATGQTYDRSSILKWFSAGNSMCPKTGKKLENTKLVPNLVLRRLIQQFCSSNGIPIGESGSRNRDITRIVVAGSPAADEAMKMAANFLAGRLAVGTSEERNKAAYEIRLLTKTSIFNRSCLAEAGTIPRLLDLLSSTDSLTQENATAALLNLSKHAKGKALIVENGGLKSISNVLRKGVKLEVRQLAAGTLYYLASIEEYRKLIGKIPGAIPALVELIKAGTDHGKKNALVAIFGLLMHPGNHCRVVAAGAVPLLLNLLTSSEREDLLTDSLAVLSNLAEHPNGTTAILQRGALHLIVGILNSSATTVEKEYCVSLLLALCINGGRDVVAVLVKNPSLMGSLYSLLAEATPRASKKASSLISILHAFYERSSNSLMTPALLQEQYVHVW